MSTVAEIESAIAKLPAKQVDEVAGWLTNWRRRRRSPTTSTGRGRTQVARLRTALRRVRGSADAGLTTDEIMRQTRGEP